MDAHHRRTVELLDMVKEMRSYAAVTAIMGSMNSYMKKDESNIGMTTAVSCNKPAKILITSRYKARMKSELTLCISSFRKTNI